MIVQFSAIAPPPHPPPRERSLKRGLSGVVLCNAVGAEQNYPRGDNLPAFPKMAPQAPRGMPGPGELNLPGALLPSADGGRCDFFRRVREGPGHRRKNSGYLASDAMSLTADREA